jgi:RecA/RadA recombinase
MGDQHGRSRGTPHTFIGRDAELAELCAGLEDAIDGRGRVFLIAGEPGAGKTMLAEQLAARAEERGARVLWGRCWEGRGAPRTRSPMRAAPRNRTDPVAQLPEQPAPNGSPPEQRALAVEQAAWLHQLLRTLPAQQCTVLTLRIVVGLSAFDTAHALGTSAGAVQVAQYRTLHQLRRRLATYTDQPVAALEDRP